MSEWYTPLVHRRTITQHTPRPLQMLKNGGNVVFGRLPGEGGRGGVGV